MQRGTAMPAVTVDGESPSAAPVLSPSVQAYAARERARAEALERDGALAEAALVWELLSLLTPTRPEASSTAPAEWARVRLAAAQGAASRLRAAQAAHQQGDDDAARRLYLAALAFEPGHAGAAQALRAMEAERSRAPRSGHPGAPSATRLSSQDKGNTAAGDALGADGDDDATVRKPGTADAPRGTAR